MATRLAPALRSVPRLRCLTTRRLWLRGELGATCDARIHPAGKAPPADRCDCGHRAVDSLEGLIDELWRWPVPLVLAEVHGWGVTQMAEPLPGRPGWRFEYAEPKLLLTLGVSVATSELLGRDYCCPVLPFDRVTG